MRNSTELNINQKELEIIKDLIYENPYYVGNEDLFPQFCEEVYQKSYLLFKSVKNYDYLLNYLKKIVNNSLITVLKRNTRTRSLDLSSKIRYMSTHKQDRTNDFQAASSDAVVGASSKFKSVYDIYKIDDPCTNNDSYYPLKKDIERTLELLEFVNSENLDKKYMQIFIARYLQNKSSELIAFEFGLSEVEVNQRLVDLADIIRENS